MKKSYIIILILVAACLALYFMPVKPSGTYLAEYPYGIEEIRLNKDGTFHQRFTFNAGLSVANTGRWKSPDENGQMVMLNFICFDDGFGTPRLNAYPRSYAMAFKSQWGRASLRFNKGLGEVYWKQ